MKKALSLLFILLCVSALLVSCGDTADTGTEADTSADTSSDTGSEESKGISLIGSGENENYQIIYDDAMSIYAACQDLKSAIYDAYSVNIFPQKSSATEISEREIIIGNTNRPESAQLLSEIAEDEYAIKLINNKVVINSSTDRGIKGAIKEFISMYVSESNKDLTVPSDLSIVKKSPSEMQTLSAGWTLKTYKASNNINLPYQIYIPNGLDADKEYPVLLFMHGLGSVGTNGEHITQTVAQFVKNLPASKYKDEVIIIAPQHPSGQKWVNVDYTKGTYSFDNTPISKYLAAAKELLDLSMQELPIDENRVYGYGNSMGAFATIYLAMTYPDLYAAIVPVAGGCDPTKAELIKDVPIWLFHGDADTTVPIIGSQTLYNNLKTLGAENAKLTVFPGIGHASQGCFVAAANNAEMMEWLFSQSK